MRRNLNAVWAARLCCFGSRCMSIRDWRWCLWNWGFRGKSNDFSHGKHHLEAEYSTNVSLPSIRLFFQILSIRRDTKEIKYWEILQLIEEKTSILLCSRSEELISRCLNKLLLIAFKCLACCFIQQIPATRIGIYSKRAYSNNKFHFICLFRILKTTSIDGFVMTKHTFCISSSR